MLLQTTEAIRFLEPVTRQDCLQAALLPTLVYQGEQEELWAVEGLISDPFVYTLVALPILEKRLKFGGLVTIGGQPITSLRELLRAVEAGEWGL